MRNFSIDPIGDPPPTLALASSTAAVDGIPPSSSLPACIDEMGNDEGPVGTNAVDGPADTAATRMQRNIDDVERISFFNGR